MSKERSEALFTLIKSLKKSEKRYFKVSEAVEGDKKYIRLFNIIDKQEAFDHDQVLLADPDFKSSQLSNLKAHLYQKVLQSLRSYSAS